jgi:hypothetical protein
MKYVPTVTRAWPYLDLEGVDEVLLTPSSTDLPPEPRTVLVDNGCYMINQGRCDRKTALERQARHTELCRTLAVDDRCVFVLPDLSRYPEVCQSVIDTFLQKVRPARFALVEHASFVHPAWLCHHAEFFCIKTDRFHLRLHPDGQYHLLGRTKRDAPLFLLPARSWDDSDYDPLLPLRTEIDRRMRYDDEKHIR